MRHLLKFLAACVALAFIAYGPAAAQVAGDNLAATQATVATTATVVCPGRSNRKAATIVNHGTVDVFLGNSDVATTTGVLLSGVKGTSLTISTTAPIYGIVAAGTQAVSCVGAY